MSINKSKGKTSSTPTTAPEYSAYFNQLNTQTGGRLGEFARTGTKALSPDEIRSVGGLGETQRLSIDRSRQRAVDDLAADPSLSVAQKFRGRQLTDEDALARSNAIDKEVEAAITGLIKDNNALTANDLELLGKLFYGGKGQTSVGKQSGSGGGLFG